MLFPVLYWSVLLWTTVCLVLIVPLVGVLAIVVRRRLGWPWLILTALLAALLVVCIPHIGRALNDVHQRSAIARELGVDINHWPWPHTFPASYFSSVLQRGTGRSEVHTTVRAYERVDHCGPDADAYTQEIYYFYSTQAGSAIRMEVQYDPEHRVSKVWTEDPDSMPIVPRGLCADGPWPD